MSFSINPPKPAGFSTVGREAPVDAPPNKASCGEGEWSLGCNWLDKAPSANDAHTQRIVRDYWPPLLHNPVAETLEAVVRAQEEIPHPEI